MLVRFPGIREGGWPPLDRQPIGPDSGLRVHLVIIGFDTYARALALNAALIAHYPNFRPEDDRPLRSRITFICNDDGKWPDQFIGQYTPLFDNSFWQEVEAETGITQYHYPMYHGKRQEFTDVEWAFVHADPGSRFVQEKLTAWAADPQSQLTIAISLGSNRNNLHCARQLPESLRNAGIPLLPWLEASSTGLSPDMTQLLREMGKEVNSLYAGSSGLSVPGVFPSVCNVMHIPTKLRSLGHDGQHPESFYTLSEAEARLMTRTEHYRWCMARLVAGDRPCTDAERKAVRENIEQILEARRSGLVPPEDLKARLKQLEGAHYDLCSFDELGLDAAGNDVRNYDYDVVAGIPQIVSRFIGNGIQAPEKS